MSSASSSEESLIESPTPLAPAALVSHPLRGRTQGEGDAGLNTNPQGNAKKRKASQTTDDPEHPQGQTKKRKASQTTDDPEHPQGHTKKRKASQTTEDPEHPKISAAKRQKKNEQEERPTEPEKKNKGNGKKGRIADLDGARGPEGAEGQRGADLVDTQPLDTNSNARYGLINEERLSTLDLDTEGNVPFTDADLTRARQGHGRQAVECFFRQLTGSAAEMNRIAEMRLEYMRPYAATNELWVTWPELSLTMRLNLIEGLVEIENSKAAKKWKNEAAKLRNELERAQVIMRDARRWEGGDDESENKQERSAPVRARPTSTAKPKKKGKKAAEDDGEETDDKRKTWLPKDEERLQRLLQEGGEDDDAQVKKFKKALDGATPKWTEAELEFSMHYTEALNHRVPRPSWDGENSNGVRELSHALRKRFEQSTFKSKGDTRRGFYRSPFAVNKKLSQRPEFRKLWGLPELTEEGTAKSKGGKTGKATAAGKKGKQIEEDKENQQMRDVDMEDVQRRGSDGDTVGDHGSDADPDEALEPLAAASDEQDADDNAGQPDGKDSSSSDESSGSDSDSDDYDQKRMAKGKARADRNTEEKRQKEIERLEKELEEAAAEAKRKEEEEEEHKRHIKDMDASAEKKRLLKNGGKAYPRKRTAEKVEIVVEEEEAMQEDGTDGQVSGEDADEDGSSEEG
ncbi:hypothetical protein EG328_006888 [Venturia inaequalis]|uniref:Uncharacterized protein n=1 Tax=Venturia inaequalis TaxID=5025 RepID=A0A8H3YQF9_VENIN|nr:hypothetical protein EG328_006888 [Venturia inaequalis]